MSILHIEGELLKEVMFEYYDDFICKDSPVVIEIPNKDIKVVSYIDAHIFLKTKVLNLNYILIFIIGS